MRWIRRAELSRDARKALGKKQALAHARLKAGTLDVQATWKSARRTQPLKEALAVLQRMAGGRERCMYCVDSHGTDIEHFWPKTPYPQRMFEWPNMLLCCTECGRWKGNAFPLDQGKPLLVNPTSDDPWQHLDFDPVTGNITARFDVATNTVSPMGVATVKLLRLDRREALASGLQSTYRRIRNRVNDALHAGQPDAQDLIQQLEEADDHGLLGWCVRGMGRHEDPFAALQRRHPAVWDAWARSVHAAR